MTGTTLNTEVEAISVDQYYYVTIPEWILLHPTLSPSAVILWGLLARFRGGNENAWPTKATLATQLSCSVRTVERLISQLVRAQAISVNSDGDKTVYYLWPKLGNESLPKLSNDKNVVKSRQKCRKAATKMSLELNSIELNSINFGDSSNELSPELVDKDQKEHHPAWEITRSAFDPQYHEVLPTLRGGFPAAYKLLETFIDHGVSPSLLQELVDTEAISVWTYAGINLAIARHHEAAQAQQKQQDWQRLQKYISQYGRRAAPPWEDGDPLQRWVNLQGGWYKLCEMSTTELQKRYEVYSP